MKLYDIDVLKRDTKQSKLYNFFVTTFKLPLSVSSNLITNKITVTEEKEMRLDLISRQLYQSDDYVDMLCHINQIDNPLNIMKDDVLDYTSLGEITAYRFNDYKYDDVETGLLNNDKTQQIDQNRKQYVEQNYSLTPTSIDVPQDPVKIVGKEIVIGR